MNPNRILFLSVDCRACICFTSSAWIVGWAPTKCVRSVALTLKRAWDVRPVFQPKMMMMMMMLFVCPSSPPRNKHPNPPSHIHEEYNNDNIINGLERTQLHHYIRTFIYVKQNRISVKHSLRIVVDVLK